MNSFGPLWSCVSLFSCCPISSFGRSSPPSRAAPLDLSCLSRCTRLCPPQHRRPPFVFGTQDLYSLCSLRPGLYSDFRPHVRASYPCLSLLSAPTHPLPLLISAPSLNVTGCFFHVRFLRSCAWQTFSGAKASSLPLQETSRVLRVLLSILYLVQFLLRDHHLAPQRSSRPHG